jgi:hypothetical protein
MSLYHHAQDAQPLGLPSIAEGEHGRGEWVVCALIVGDKGEEEPEFERWSEGVEGEVKDWVERVGKEEGMGGVRIKAGVWRGDVLLSK